MERNEVIEKSRGIISRVLKNDNFVWNGEQTATDINGWDSLSHMIIMAELENEFRIQFKLKELNRLTDLDSLISLVESKI
jgi:acyl carrier protein